MQDAHNMNDEKLVQSAKNARMTSQILKIFKIKTRGCTIKSRLGYTVYYAESEY